MDPESQGERHTRMKAEIGMLLLATSQKDQKLGKRPRADSLSEPSAGTRPANTLMLNFCPPARRDKKIALSKPARVWHFVTAAEQTNLIQPACFYMYDLSSPPQVSLPGAGIG